MLECFRLAYIYVPINGSTIEEFRLGRGLRQRNPLSLFSFVLAADALSM